MPLILAWLNSFPGQAEDHCPQVVYWAPWTIVIVSSIGVSSLISCGGEMEIMAVYCIPFIMSCLLACCFIATLLHSRTILVCKLYVFTLICNRYDIKINEFMFLIHQQELSPVVSGDQSRWDRNPPDEY